MELLVLRHIRLRLEPHLAPRLTFGMVEPERERQRRLGLRNVERIAGGRIRVVHQLRRARRLIDAEPVHDGLSGEAFGNRHRVIRIDHRLVVGRLEPPFKRRLAAGLQRGPAFQQRPVVRLETRGDRLDVHLVPLLERVRKRQERAAIHDHALPADMAQRPCVVRHEPLRLIEPDVRLLEEFTVEVGVSGFLPPFEIVTELRHRTRRRPVVGGHEAPGQGLLVLIRVLGELQEEPVLEHGERTGKRRFVLREVVLHVAVAHKPQLRADVRDALHHRQRLAGVVAPVPPKRDVRRMASPLLQRVALRRAAEERREDVRVAVADEQVVGPLHRLRRLHGVGVGERLHRHLGMARADAPGDLAREVDHRPRIAPFGLGERLAPFAHALAG